MDYPNWEANKMENIKHLHLNQRTNILPFFGKPSNKEYGDFYDKGVKVKNHISLNPDHKKCVNPLGPKIPIPPKTSYNKDFVKYS